MVGLYGVIKFFISAIEVTYIGTSCSQATKAPSLSDALQVAKMDQQQQGKNDIHTSETKVFVPWGQLLIPKRRCI
jgi:hypothetical protein